MASTNQSTRAQVVQPTRAQVFLSSCTVTYWYVAQTFGELGSTFTYHLEVHRVTEGDSAVPRTAAVGPAVVGPDVRQV